MLRAPKARHSLAPSVAEVRFSQKNALRDKGGVKQREKKSPYRRRPERSASGATQEKHHSLRLYSVAGIS
jgi:hypothetical protein